MSRLRLCASVAFVLMAAACNGIVDEPLGPKVAGPSPPVSSASPPQNIPRGASPDPEDGPLASVKRSDVLAVMAHVNDTFMAKWPDPGANVITNTQPVPSNTWARAVYFEGLMAFYAQNPKVEYRDYAGRWGESHAWGLAGGTSTRNADDHSAGQSYVELYEVLPDTTRLIDLDASLEAMIQSPDSDDWTWADAIQMAMPAFAKLGVVKNDTRYFEKMHALYTHTKSIEGGHGLYNPVDHLWWRDHNFVPPYAEPNGEDCYWSRGNGWVYAGLARVLDVLPLSDPHRAEYVADFQDMSEALRNVRRADGYWNVSLHDETHFGGREMTGTSLFTYGMAWGVRKGLLSRAIYEPLVMHSWQAMTTRGVHANGMLGYVQGTAREPSNRQPVTFETVPNTEDFPIGCFLLAGSEIAQLATR